MILRASIASLLLVLSLSCEEKRAPMNHNLFIGTYTDGASDGIYSFTFDSNSGKLSDKQLVAKLPNPSFLAVSKDRKRLYAVQETADYNSLGGGVTAFSLKDGMLTALNSKGSGGAHPCHVALSSEGQLAVSNYTGGNLALFDLNDDGSLGERQLIDHTVLSALKTAHVHKAHFNEEGLFAADLGLDAIKRYAQIDGTWQPAEQSTLTLPKGSGPRHFVFNTDRSFLYVINELNATVTVFGRDEKGEYQVVQTVKTLAGDYSGANSCADIHLSSDGKFLYGSNRGENSIVIFSVDQKNGKLSLVGRESVRGDWPRNFAIDPSGNFLLVANQKSNNISMFQRDPEKGTLTFLEEVAMPAPVCLVFE